MPPEKQEKENETATSSPSSHARGAMAFSPVPSPPKVETVTPGPWLTWSRSGSRSGQKQEDLEEHLRHRDTALVPHGEYGHFSVLVHLKQELEQ